MAIAERPSSYPVPPERPRRTQPSRTPPREPLYRKKELHLLVGVIVAALTVAFAAQRATQGAQAVLDARLVHAGAGADAALVDVESEQLSVARAIAFTPGVAEHLSVLDGPGLNKLVAPLQANSTVPMVDMLVPDGRVLLAVRSKGAPRPVLTRAGLNALTYARTHADGPRGGRLSEIVVFKRGGATLVTVSPIMMNGTGRLTGYVLAMTPLANVLARISQEVWAELTAYDQNGNPLATTATYVPKPLPRATARSLMAGGAVVTRYVYADHREKLGRLIVDHAANAVLGVALEDDTNVVGRNVALDAVIGLICTVLILATFWARVMNARRMG